MPFKYPIFYILFDRMRIIRVCQILKVSIVVKNMQNWSWEWLYVVCSIFQVKFVLKMLVIVCSTLVVVCSTGRLNFVLQKNV